MTVYDAERHILGILPSHYYRGEARGIASTVISHITGTTARDRIWDKTTTLTQEQQRLYDKYIPELRAGKPVEYVLNEDWFNDLKFYVDENVTLPRGRSAEMIEWILQSFSFEDSDPAYKEKELNILDIGTGSGCIAIALKKLLPVSRMYACDISEKALQVAKRNAESNEVQIEFLHMDFLDRNEWEKTPTVDLIVCNPPWVPNDDHPTFTSMASSYEPYEGLYIDHNDPLIFYKAIAAFAQKKLKPKAFLFAQIHGEPGPDLINLFKSSGFLPYIYQSGIYNEDQVIRVHLNL